VRGRLNQIQRRVAAIKEEVDNSVLVATGVWRCDASGEVIPDSGSMQRLPREGSNAYGVLLVPAPVSKEDWPEVVKRCEEYQQQIEQDLS
jgi:hypothetical protein